MADTAHFTYEGHATLNLGGKAEKAPEIEILHVENLIPIKVSFKRDGEETVASAYIDYSTRAIYVPPSEEETVGDVAHFKSSLLSFFDEEERRQEEENVQREVAISQMYQNQAQERIRAAQANAFPDDDDDE